LKFGGGTKKGLIPACGTEIFEGGPNDRDPCAYVEEDATCVCLSRGSHLLLFFADDSNRYSASLVVLIRYSVLPDATAIVW
jgi:hypothetical protein